MIFGINKNTIQYNNNKFQLNSDVCNKNSTHKCGSILHQVYHYIKRVYSVGIKVFNRLPLRNKNLSYNPKQFKSESQNYLYAHS
jgi:hypothetical protein